MQDNDTPEVVSGTTEAEEVQHLGTVLHSRESFGFTPERLADMGAAETIEHIDRGIAAMDMMEGQLRILIAHLQSMFNAKQEGKPFDVWAKDRWKLSRRRIFQLLEEGAIQAKLLETATGPAAAAIPKLSGRALRALPSEPVAAVEVVAKAVETGQIVQKVLAPTPVAAIDRRGPEPAPGFAHKLWVTDCRACGHNEEHHHIGNANVRLRCKDCSTCTGYVRAQSDPAPVVVSKAESLLATALGGADEAEDPAGAVIEAAERAVLGDMRWLKAATDLQALLNSPQTKRGIVELAMERPKARAAVDRLRAVIAALSEVELVLMGVEEVSGVG